VEVVAVSLHRMALVCATLAEWETVLLEGLVVDGG